MTMGLRVPQVSSFRDMAMQHGAQGLSAYSQQRPGSTTERTAPDKTAGGALMGGAGMAMAGAEFGGMISASAAAGPIGAGIGFGVGILSYMLS